MSTHVSIAGYREQVRAVQKLRTAQEAAASRLEVARRSRYACGEAERLYQAAAADHAHLTAELAVGEQRLTQIQKILDRQPARYSTPPVMRGAAQPANTF
jgi:hypothetical protein